MADSNCRPLGPSPRKILSVGVQGIEPCASRSQTERSTDELHSVFTGQEPCVLLLNYSPVIFSSANRPFTPKNLISNFSGRASCATLRYKSSLLTQVVREGVEPTPPCGDSILSAARLP